MAKSEKKKVAAHPRKPSGKLSGKPSAKAVRKPSKGKKLPLFVGAPESDIGVLDRLFAIIESRRDADVETSHSARLLSRGPAKVAQKFGEEAVECLIEAVAGNHDALVAESADVLYHLLVLWVSSGVTSREVWSELVRREGISGIAEKAARARPAVVAGKFGTSKIP
nr:phosphoribosyl-ATP diphosphatase [uncultured Rhodopila sp.]